MRNLLSASVLLLALLPGLAAEPEDEGRAVVKRFFAAYPAKDVDGLMALWSEKVPDFAARKQAMKQLFAQTKDIQLKELTLVRVEINGGSARVRLKVEWSGFDARTGAPHPALGKFNRVMLLARENGVWKVTRYESAEAVLVRALSEAATKEERQRLLKDEKELFSPNMVLALLRECEGRITRGELLQAERLEQAARAMAEALQDKIGLGWCQMSRAQIQFFRCDYAESLRYGRQALALFRDLKNRRGEGSALLSIGNIEYSTGRYTEALRHFQDSIAIMRELGDRSEEASALVNLGVVYLALSRYGEALRTLQDGLTIERELRDREAESNTLGNIAIVYGSTGRHAEALRYCQESLKITRELRNPNGEARSLNNLANVLGNMGRRDEELQCLQDGLRILRQLGDRAGEAGVLNNMGNVLGNLGRYEEELRCFQDSLRIKRELGDRAGEATTLNNIGHSYKSAGRLDDALKNYEASLKLSEQSGRPETTLGSYWGIGDVRRARKQWERAAAAYRRAIEGIESVRSGARERSLQTSLFARYVSPYHGFVLCLHELDRPADAFAAAERAKARALLDLLQSGKADIRKGMTEEQHQKEQQLQQRLTVLAVEREALRSRKLNPKRQEELARELEQARQEDEVFRRDLFLRLPELGTRRAEFTPATLADLNRLLFADHPKLVVLSYLVANKETVLFVLTRGDKTDGPARLAVHRVEIEEKELAESVRQFRAACQKPGGGTPEGADLYRLLLAPVEDTLAGASHVVIVPDGALHTLPLHALKDGEEGEYLIQRCTVSYAPSATALLKMAEVGRRRRQANTAGLLAAGIGDFGRRERLLPNAEPEARAVAALFAEQGRVLSGSQATKAKLRALWSDCRYLHFATHGRLNEDVPLYSALVLSPSEGGRDEGLLFGRDLLDEELSAELVVLSACETGLGKHARGEGLLGLTWAWFVAGVPSTVASQWSVADDSTARLMQVFYTELKGGAPKAEALRRAQLALLKDRKTRHPFYWAPFALSGDPW